VGEFNYRVSWEVLDRSLAKVETDVKMKERGTNDRTAIESGAAS
jgi:hypothetical protein